MDSNFGMESALIDLKSDYERNPNPEEFDTTNAPFSQILLVGKKSGFSTEKSNIFVNILQQIKSKLSLELSTYICHRWISV
jgi:hypothetical protein